MKELEIKFTDSKQVEASFYQAFRDRDIGLMKNVWDQTDSVICIHPSSPRIYSFDLIIASWEQIFAAQEPVDIEISGAVFDFRELIGIHYVTETLSVMNRVIGSVYATNIYHQTEDGWKMIAHHASPAYSSSEPGINPNLH